MDWNTQYQMAFWAGKWDNYFLSEGFLQEVKHFPRHIVINSKNHEFKQIFKKNNNHLTWSSNKKAAKFHMHLSILSPSH